jgi:hypothetical protein
MLLRLRMLANRGLADRYYQRIHRQRVERQLLLRANIHAKHYAELVEELQFFTLRRIGASRMHNATHKANQGQLSRV